MSSGQKEAYDEAEREWRESDRCSTLQANKAEYARLIARPLPANLSTAELLFLTEQPTPFSQWSTTRGTELRFYTDDRLDRIRNILSRALPTC